MTSIPKGRIWRVRLAAHCYKAVDGAASCGAMDSVGPDDVSKRGRLSTFRRLLVSRYRPLQPCEGSRSSLHTAASVAVGKVGPNGVITGSIGGQREGLVKPTDDDFPLKMGEPRVKFRLPPAGAQICRIFMPRLEEDASRP
jgi:hypothetical protein